MMFMPDEFQRKTYWMSPFDFCCSNVTRVKFV